MSTKWILSGLLISYHLYYHQITTPDSWCFQKIYGSNTTRSLVTNPAICSHEEQNLSRFFSEAPLCILMFTCRFVESMSTSTTCSTGLLNLQWSHSESHSTCDCTSIDKIIWSSHISYIPKKWAAIYIYIEHVENLPTHFSNNKRNNVISSI